MSRIDCHRRHADDVDQAVDATECDLGIGGQPGGIGAGGDVTHPRHGHGPTGGIVELGRDVGGTIGLEDRRTPRAPRAGLCEGMAGHAAHALTGAGDDEAPPVDTEPVQEVGNGRRIRGGHDITTPPLGRRICPVTNLEASLAR